MFEEGEESHKVIVRGGKGERERRPFSVCDLMSCYELCVFFSEIVFESFFIVGSVLSRIKVLDRNGVVVGGKENSSQEL